MSECRRPTILSLGCGDMRSCMYTIWKNFGFEGENSNGFSGVNFVLNDCSASVLARNILFLYLCMCMPGDEVSRKEWIASMWSLWYNHELQPQHAKMLSDALAQLFQWSHTWQEWSECPLGGVVQFSSPATFASVKMIWSKWNSPIKQSVDEMKLARSSFQSYSLNTYEINTREEGFKDITKTLLKSIHMLHSSEMIDIMEKEYLHYLMEGTVWGENVLGIPSSTLKTVVNPTLIERQDGMYTLGYVLTPYVGFIQTFQYSHTEICGTLGKENTFLQFLPVADHHFRDVPLLANSVQQFAMWLVGTAHMIRNTSQTVSGDKVSFVFDLDDAMNLCHFLYHQPEIFSESLVRIAKFDAIYTSNLFDHLSPPALVLSALPLLKPDGTLFTCTFEHITQTSREYLETMFGFSPELFPALLGIRCLGEDGEYSSLVNNEPCPNYVFTYFKTFLWRNIKSQSLIIDAIEVSPHATKSLLRLYDISCLHVLMYEGSVESFLIILHQFLKQLQSSCASSHHFFKFLSTAIRTKAQFKPHFLQLQTQSLLHGVHMHITLTEDNCPLCRGQPLESYLQQFTVSLDITAKAQVYGAPTFSINLVSLTGDVALVASVACRSCGPTLALDFYLPKQCLSQYSTFSVNMFRNGQQVVVIAGSMYDLVSSETEYIFLKPNTQPCATAKHRYVCPLGSIVKHIGDESTFETLVSMNDACLMEMKMSKMSIKLTEPNQLKLCCGALSATIVYPYAVNESKTHIKVLNNILSVTVDRGSSVFYKEKPTFYVDPSNKWALPRIQCHADVIDMYCNLQMPQSSPDHPLLHVKHCFTELFKCASCGEKYFTLFVPSKCIMGTPDIHALVYVHDVRFSTAFSSPVLDVSYCFLDTKPMHLTPDFAAMHNHLSPSRSIMVDDAAYKLLKEIFNYFLTAICCAFSSERHTVTLPVEKHRLWKYFDHAILFPLYPNPANPNVQSRIPILGSITTSQELLTLLASEIMSSCTFCGKISTALKKCERCRKAEYCGRECQLKHRPIHKSACNASDTLPKNRTPTQNDATSLPQMRKKSRSSDLNNISSSSSPAAQHTPLKQSPLHSETMTSTLCKRCKKRADVDCLCKSVSYYGKEYQTLDGPDHEKKCNQPADDSSSIDQKTSPTIPSNLDREYSGYCADKDTAIALESRVCMRCRKPAIITCSCELVWYCSKTCQTLEQAEHNNKCRKKLQKASTVVPSSKRRDHSNRSDNDASNNLSTVCIRCKKPATIKCLCKSVSYCSSACQTLEWPEHGKTCSSSEKKLHKPSPVVPSNKGKGHGGSPKTESGSALNSVSKVCMRCTKPATINCSCKLVSYCSKACQTLEWPEHSQECIPPEMKLHKPPPVVSSSKGQDHGKCFESDASNSASNVCKRCKKPATINCSCRSVSYCSKACQTLEWPEHREKCNSPHKKLHNPPPVVSKSKGQYHSSGSESDASNSVNTLCTRCKKPATIRCSCRSVLYCSKACQTLEWPEHSHNCNPPANRSPPTDPICKDPHPPCSKDNREPIATHNLKCSNCNKTKSQLKRCKCHNVSYCSVECQRLHWPQHKHICSAVRK